MAFPMAGIVLLTVLRFDAFDPVAPAPRYAATPEHEV